MKFGNFYIAFDTRDMPGVIKATRVDISIEFVRSNSKSFAINLCDHPLYPQLVEYVKNNPVRKQK